MANRIKTLFVLLAALSFAGQPVHAANSGMTGEQTAEASVVDDDDDDDEGGSAEGEESDEDGEASEGEEEGLHAVDLGLSVKWASCNLGGEKPEDAGDGYAWGETTTKGNYSWESYKYFKERSKENGNPIMTKYVYTQCGYSAYSGDRDGRGTLEPEDDAAHVVLGEDWRMPTFGELQELYKKAKWETFKTDDGKECYRITGPNGNSIVLNQEDIWTSSTSNDCAQYNAMSLHSVKMNGCTVSERRAPYKIRPVKP